VPAATPAPIQQKLREAVRAAVKDPAFSGAMEKVGSPIDYRDAPEFKKYWDADAARLKAALQKIGKVEDKK
jgi:tripartite-type tricarboxylate transporter receptor subunit TctC